MITKDDFTERYVEAVIRSLPVDQRVDHAEELRASIADQIEARVEDGESEAAAERAVLAELGDPTRLAAGYAGRPMQLIGPAVYPDWKRLLVLLLWIVVPIGMVGGAIGPAIDREMGGAIAGAVVTGMIAGLHVCFWVTLVFAIVERTGGTTSWKVELLPLRERRRAGISEAIVGFAVMAVFVLAVVWDHLIGFVQLDAEPLSILSPEIWPWSAIGVGVLMGLRALIETIGLTGRRTALLASLATIVTAIGAITIVWLIAEGRAINPAFVEYTGIPDDAAHVIAVLLIVLTIGLAVWDVIDTLRRIRRRA
ncbi:permease prefix domain 1-containing protein [Microbacterium sp. G2-8]|uniref:permease prefix domain 1-containing protein n=1 Tax=Microbacterium sp. G2-8 TaxID=2842454 RepID=UPI001C8A4DBD|nr:permease prefix domain 1-containing protein [Microbacterium sp. G2-8]